MTSRAASTARPEATLSPQARQWVLGALGSGATIHGTRPLAGATSSTLHLLRASSDRGRQDVVLRLFTHREWLAAEPDLAEHEASSLENAALAGIPAPRLLAFEPTGDMCGAPAVLMTRVPGRIVLRPDNLDRWLCGLAEAIYPLHQLTPVNHPWRYQPYNDPTSLCIPGWSSVPELWERALEIVNGPWPPCRHCFAHRDYHPNNVLWEGDAVSGIVDWPNGCHGPAGIDVAWCRRNLIHLVGLEAGERFVRAYERLAGPGYAHDPFWDLMALIEVLPGPPKVYAPWVTYGARGVTPGLMAERLDQLLASLLARL